MNPEWIITGIILLGAMAAAGISLYLKRRRAARDSIPTLDKTEPEDKK